MFALLIAALAAPLLALAAPVQLSKRTSGRATYYEVGLGACGQYNYPGDFIVALNEDQFYALGRGYPSPQCGRGITISYNGKTAHATVMDMCPSGGCSYGDLDFSQGLFTHFESTSAGVFYMNWEFDGEGAAPPPPPPPPPPPAYTPPATTETSTSTYTPTTTSTTSSSSSVSSLSSTQEVSNQAVPSGDSASPEPTPDSGNALGSINMVAVHLANLVFAAGHA